jgi:hypothetical protein
MANYELQDLVEWDARIRDKVAEFGLDCFTQEFELCDHFGMLGYMAYSGMPSHYPHWSYGKSYEKLKTLYDHGVSGLPYEMVINSDPALAYLMRDNTLLLQILTIAHVYGHNDFFKNNFTYRTTRASLTIELFKAHALRVRHYAEDPSIGVEKVEHVLDAAHALIKETFARSKLPFMNCQSLRRFMLGLGDKGKLITAEYQGVLQSCVIYAFSDYCAYAVYAGNVVPQHQGANKLVYWEAFRLFKKLGARRFDFVGARINPEKGSKQEAINLFKQRLGAKLTQGYIWKYPLRPWRSLAYSYGVRLLRGGDIVDMERHKMKDHERAGKSFIEACQGV